MGNMYGDSVLQWNVIVGCKFDCIYCKKSFQAQMKRQKHNCIKCYEYEPHFHEERLDKKLPKTEGDQFIWVASSSDIYFAERAWINKILTIIRANNDKTFFFQTKNPMAFKGYDWPENVIFGITLESNREYNISRAPKMKERYNWFWQSGLPRKSVTIEPIMDFDMKEFVEMILGINPERVYIGYDTKKCGLDEPSLKKTMELIRRLREFTKVKEKLLRPGNAKGRKLDEWS